MLRLTAPAGERLESAGRLEAYVAGAEANVAAALARLGIATAWVSALPASPLGDRVARELTAAGVDLAFVERVTDARLGLFFVELGSEPRATRVWYDRAGSAFSRLETIDPSALAGAEFAVISGITPAIGAASRALAEAFVREAHAQGVRVCVDVNYRSLLWSADAAREGLAELLVDAAVVVCGERDARVVFGIDSEAGDAVQQLAERWAPAAEIVVLTRADRGSDLFTDGETIRRKAPDTRVIDRFGAGDAFTAGLLWALLEGRAHSDALEAATALAALKCTTFGDLARFGRDELEAAIREQHGQAIMR